MPSSDDRKTTIDHGTIKRWVETCGGEPAAVSADAPEEAGMLRLRFPDADGDDADSEDVNADRPVESLDWPDFFERFEEQELALVYREETDGESNRSDPRPWFEFEDRVFAGEF